MRIGELTTDLPIVGAPMAGGPTTPELVAGVSDGGGLGTLAAGYLTVDALEALVADVERLTSAPYAVNLFLGGPDVLADPEIGDRMRETVDDYRRELAPEAERLGVEPGEARYSDEFVDDKIAMLARYRPALISVTFGAPSAHLVARVHNDVGVPLAVTVTSVGEATRAVALGADALIAQGIEAGGHRGLWRDDPLDPLGGPALPTTELVDEIVAVTDRPVIAAGGIADSAAVRALTDRGAAAAQVGTLLLCRDEAGTSAVHRGALLERRYTDTLVTRAFSGRSARSLRNRFAEQHSATAPAAYPHVHHVTKPLRAAAAKAGDPDGVNLWAGTGWRAARSGPVRELMDQFRAELGTPRD
ncbi:nitronate monooxygenase [Gordonia sinesedis]